MSKVLAAPERPKGPYQACIATYGSAEGAEKVVVSIVDMKRRLVIDNRTWDISEYDNDSNSVETVMGTLTHDMMDYCERSRAGRIFIIDVPFSLQALEEKCLLCRERIVRVPWQDL